MKKVCVQGLGFVGSAIAVAIANAKNNDGNFIFNVAGIDLENISGQQRIKHINQGIFPFPNNDQELKEATFEAIQRGNLKAYSDPSHYKDADYIIVSIPFNLSGLERGERQFLWDDFKESIRQFSCLMRPECLVIVETTVPPGTCRQVILPIIQKEFSRRNIQRSPLLAHSYERVMPGTGYLRSITEYYRCYAGIDEHSADLCRIFLSQLIKIEKYPLVCLSSVEASEIAKVLENSYRAVNIAFIEEWTVFAEQLNVDLHEIVNAIRMRPTHSNIRQPGFGVGGYCLTKDPLFAQQAAQEIYHYDHKFPFCEMAVKVNQNMPKRSFNALHNYMKNITGKKLLILGVSYKADVGDTRFSPSASFVAEAKKHGMELTYHDPLVSYWEELNTSVEKDIDSLDFSSFDAIVIAVPHTEYMKINFSELLLKPGAFILDACGIIQQTELYALKEKGNTIFVIGKGKI
jgi:UDP-N-acetyl-D-glucosamine dehydrogenase